MLVADIHFELFELHRQELNKAYRRSLATEDLLVESPSFETFREHQTKLSRIRDVEVSRRRRHGDLFTAIYSDSYFGIRQAIEADAIVFAIRKAYRSDAITGDHRRWLTIALGRALLKVANSTGHFAQYLKPRESSYQRFLSQRRRTLWAEWLASTAETKSVSTADWRRRNKCFNQDSLLLLPSLRRMSECPGVIYADPPYTDDQYSRYYHIFETLVLYDYPATSGAGLYRPNRFTSSFSLKSQAVQAFDTLVASAVATGADLVLSYPTNGLVFDCGDDPRRLLQKYYRKVECCYSLPHHHSTFGASKGAVRSRVTERIYLAKS